MHIHEEHGIPGVIGDAVMITAFVCVIMLIVEYFNVLTSGRLQGRLVAQKWKQYLLGVALGIVPGCLGGFAVVSMFAHGVLSIGAVVATMIATTGDEAFFMATLFPRTYLLMTLGLVVLGIAVGALTDFVMRKRSVEGVLCDQKFELHEHEDTCECFNLAETVRQWKSCTPVRGILAVALGLFTFVVIGGYWETEKWDWIRVTLLGLSLTALFIVSTVPDHFLQEHLWEHVARKHVPRIFAWTLGTLLLMFLLTAPLENERLSALIAAPEAKWIALLAACLIGLIPQSGPHLVFVFAYAQGTIPLGVLVASSIVQDGHSMLPMLAHSRRIVAGIKVLKVILALLIGGAMILLSPSA